MKKLITLILLFTITLFYSIPTQAALTAPALFDYSFVYDATDGEFQFKDGTNSYTPEFTRTANGIYFNYEYIGDGDGLLPFEITLSFNRSNTSWTLGTIGYIATDTKIGSNNLVGTITKKTFVGINNIESDFLLYYDMSSTSAANRGFNYKNNNENVINFSLSRFILVNDVFNVLYLNAYNNFFLESSSTGGDLYIDSIYFKNLGTSNAFTAGEQSTTAYENGFTAGFGDGYQQGVQEDNAYALGYARGLLEGSDMETGSSLLILIVALIGFILMIIGFITKRGIFNLLSTGAFIVLGGLLVEFVGFIIIAIGLVLINIYYAFFGNI
jgi:hypothetical protein